MIINTLRLKKKTTHIFVKLLFVLSLAAILSACHKDSIENRISTDNAEDVRYPKCWNDLIGSKVAVIMGSVSDDYLSAHQDSITLMRLSTTADVVAAVECGRADYGVLDKLEVPQKYLAQRNIKIMFESAEVGGDAAFVFNLDDSALCRQYNDFFDSLCVCGRYDTIRSRWIECNFDNVKMPDIPQPKGSPIYVATLSTDPPFSYLKDGQWYGWEIEILKLFGQHIGRPMVFMDYSFAALITAVVKKRADMAAGYIFITEERARSVLFSKSYGSCPEVCIGRMDGLAKSALSTNEKFKDRVNENWFVENRWKMILEGLEVTIYISVGALLIGVVLGVLLCFFKIRSNKIACCLIRLFNGFMKGVPMLVILMIMFYLVLVNTKIPATMIATIAFALSVGSNLSEVFYNSIKSVDKGQKEAGLALGLSEYKCFKKIVLPLAIKKVIRPLKNEVLSLVKGTSIVGYIAIQDLTKMGDLIRSRTFDSFFPLFTITAIYLIFACLLNLMLAYLMKKS